MYCKLLKCEVTQILFLVRIKIKLELAEILDFESAKHHWVYNSSLSMVVLQIRNLGIFLAFFYVNIYFCTINIALDNHYLKLKDNWTFWPSRPNGSRLFGSRHYGSRHFESRHNGSNSLKQCQNIIPLSMQCHDILSTFIWHCVSIVWLCDVSSFTHYLLKGQNSATYLFCLLWLPDDCDYSYEYIRSIWAFWECQMIQHSYEYTKPDLA